MWSLRLQCREVCLQQACSCGKQVGLTGVGIVAGSASFNQPAHMHCVVLLSYLGGANCVPKQAGTKKLIAILVSEGTKEPRRAIKQQFKTQGVVLRTLTLVGTASVQQLGRHLLPAPVQRCHGRWPQAHRLLKSRRAAYAAGTVAPGTCATLTPRPRGRHTQLSSNMRSQPAGLTSQHTILDLPHAHPSLGARASRMLLLSPVPLLREHN